MKRQPANSLDQGNQTKPQFVRGVVTRQVSYSAKDLASTNETSGIQEGIVEDWDNYKMDCEGTQAPERRMRRNVAFGADVESVWDKLATMKILEECPEYQVLKYLSLPNSSRSTSQNPVNEYCREQICEWSYRVVDYFNVNREVVSVALSYLDRFMSKYAKQHGCLLDRRTYKLVATTALYVAVKIHESTATYHLNLLSILANLSRGEFTQMHITEMEKLLLHQLKFRVHPATTVGYIHHFLLMPPFVGNTAGQRDVEPSISRQLLDTACFYAELAVMDFYFCTEKPSIVAVAALMESIERSCGPAHVGHEVCNRFWTQVVHPLFGDDMNREHLVQVQARLKHVYDNFYVNANGQEEEASKRNEARNAQAKSPVSVMHQNL